MIDENYYMSDVAFVSASIIARLKDLIDTDNAITEKEKKKLRNKTELFFLTGEVCYKI